MKSAYMRRVWWPLSLQQFDENGVETKGTAVVLVTVLDKAAMKAMQDVGFDSIASAQQMISLRALVSVDATAQPRIDLLQSRCDDNHAKALAMVQECVHDWRRVDDAVTGESIGYSADMLRDLLRFGDFQAAFTNALREASNGARAKN